MNFLLLLMCSFTAIFFCGCLSSTERRVDAALAEFNAVKAAEKASADCRSIDIAALDEHIKCPVRYNRAAVLYYRLAAAQRLEKHYLKMKKSAPGSAVGLALAKSVGKREKLLYELRRKSGLYHLVRVNDSLAETKIVFPDFELMEKIALINKDENADGTEILTALRVAYADFLTSSECEGLSDNEHIIAGYRAKKMCALHRIQEILRVKNLDAATVEYYKQLAEAGRIRSAR